MAASPTRDLGAAPPPPDVPMSLRERIRCVTAFHTGLAEIAAAGGPVASVRLGPRRLTPQFVVVTSPQGAHDVLAASDGAFDKDMVVHVQIRALGDNVFNLLHEPWLRRRRSLQPIFTKKHVAGFASHMAAIADESAAAFAAAGEVDLDAEMRRLTLRVIGRSVFGLDLDSQAADLGPHVRRVLEYVTHRALRPVRAPRWLPTPARHRMRASLAVLQAICDAAVSAVRAGGGEDAELVRLLLEATDPETGEPLSDSAVRGELLIFLLAGHDTTATTLTYTLWALGRDRALQDRVADEVSSLGSRTLVVEDVPQLPFTVQVLHEALRMCPPAPAVGRLAMRDAVVDGFRISKGTNVVVGAYAMHHDPALWDDPERFDPDRFSPEQSAGRDRWQFLPFGAGPRSCIADHFAMLEATMALATIIRAVEIESHEATFPVALPFTMTADGKIPARATARVRSPA